ncbi:MAG: hydroxyethylthiazole kinase, partial [Spirochaetales bacterium]|jgi:hydroxyethylthiazole kinase|nr:hydroxyethylthiazole kinase [Spirochaetales bacterium]
MISARSVWEDIVKIRERSPLVHNITNFVVMNNTANALLALGASPVMAHADEEVEEMVSGCGALVINIGTLSAQWVGAMEKAMLRARERGVPVVFDPVGVGATGYRSRTADGLLGTAAVRIIRGNASEISALVSSGTKMKGVDSSMSSDSASGFAKTLSGMYGCVVSLSGETDYIVQGERRVCIRNGHPLMPRVTGLGCSASALSAAFAAVNEDAFAAAAHAMAVMGIAGELAAREAKGPGSFQVHFLDALYGLRAEDIENLLRTDEN